MPRIVPQVLSPVEFPAWAGERYSVMCRETVLPSLRSALWSCSGSLCCQSFVEVESLHCQLHCALPFFLPAPNSGEFCFPQDCSSGCALCCMQQNFSDRPTEQARPFLVRLREQDCRTQRWNQMICQLLALWVQL